MDGFKGLVKTNSKGVKVLLDCYAYGISNELSLRQGVQFFDFDGKPTPNQLKTILKRFPNDCLRYITEHGSNMFISFTPIQLIHSISISKGLSEILNEDYKMSRNLILRISPKYDVVSQKTRANKPIFLEFTKKPKIDSKISQAHLNFYRNYMDLPKEIFDFYSDNCFLCHKQVRIAFYYCRAKDKQKNKEKEILDTKLAESFVKLIKSQSRMQSNERVNLKPLTFKECLDKINIAKSRMKKCEVLKDDPL